MTSSLGVIQFKDEADVLNAKSKREVEFGEDGQEYDSGFNEIDQEKLDRIVKNMKIMREERRARELIMNLPSRMLKGLDKRKFELLQDESFIYEEQKYAEMIKQNEINSKKMSKHKENINYLEQTNQPDKKEVDEEEQSQKEDEKEKEIQHLKIKRNSIEGDNNIGNPKSGKLDRLANVYQQFIRQSSQRLQKLLEQIPVISPSSSFKLGWDMLNMMIILIGMYFVPITIIFNLSYSSLVSKQLMYVLPNVLVMDLLVNMNTGYFSKGQVVKSHLSIIQNYGSHNMVKDIISVLPFIASLYADSAYQLGINDTTNEYYLSSWSSSNFMKILKMLFFLKIRSFSQILKKVQERFNLSRRGMNLLQLAKLLFTIVLINHLFACLWVFVARIENLDPDEKTWMDGAGISGTGWQTQYITAYYFTTVTMITVGYGDILPKNAMEMILCVITMMIACGVFGYSLNEVGAIFSSFFQVDNEIRMKIASIQRFMSLKGINNKLQYQIREYLEYYWRESAEMNQEQEQIIIKQLSDSLRQKLLFEANKIVLKDSPIFKLNFSKQVIEQTVPLINEIKYSPETYICLENIQDDQSIFFIENGSVEIILNSKSKHPRTLFTLKKGDSFGAQTFFTGLPRRNNVRSKEFTTVLKIRRSDFLQLLSDNSQDHETFCSIRDQVTYLSDFTRIGITCYACNSSRHLANECQFLHFIPNIPKLIKFHNDVITTSKKKSQYLNKNKQLKDKNP